MSLRPAEVALPDVRAARRSFDRAARAFEDACVVHDHARGRLLERLDLVRIDPRTILDVGCATGIAARRLADRYPHARVLALDSSLGMTSQAREQCATAASVAVVGGDAERLPICDRSVQLLLANMSLLWCRPQAVFGEAARVLGEGGLAMFATLGPDTLLELRRAWSAADDEVHVHAFVDMHDLGDLAVACGLAEPVMDVDRIEVSYESASALVRDLRACGAVNVASGRRRSLTGARRWRSFERALLSGARGGRFAVTFELVLGQAWGTGGGRSSTPGSAEFGVPVDRIARRPGRGGVEP